MIRQISIEEFEQTVLPEYPDDCVSIDSDSLIQVLQAYRDHVAIFVSEVESLQGVIVSMANPSPFNLSEIIAQNFIWYVWEEYRHKKVENELMQAHEKWAADVGATSVMMGTFLEGRNQSDKYFKRYGYEPYQVNYIKKV